jgi:hypothetical protein
MNIGNYIMTPVVREAVTPPPQPPVQAVTNAATLVAQNVTLQTRTQTTLAAQAVGNSDASQSGQSRNQGGGAMDSQASTLNARTNRSAAGGGGGGRGGIVNIRV